jgi:thioredoxin 2
MAPVLEAAALELEPACRFVKVNTDEEPAAARRHQIRGIPTFAIFRNGNEVARASGAMDTLRFIDWIRANT